MTLTLANCSNVVPYLRACSMPASAKIAAQTGIEMEALTAVNVAALTIYDMCKAADKKMRITNVKLVSKTKSVISNQ